MAPCSSLACLAFCHGLQMSRHTYISQMGNRSVGFSQSGFVYPEQQWLHLRRCMRQTGLQLCLKGHRGPCSPPPFLSHISLRNEANLPV